jgi:hypothetical protein
MAKFESPIQVIRVLENEANENIPSRFAIKDLYDKFCEFGTVLDLERSGRPKISDELSTDLITEILEENPKSTVTQISSTIGISQRTILRRIHEVIGMKSYRIQIHQQLEDEDYDRRVEMADILLPILNSRGNKDLIFFSDESTFHISGRVHKQNCRIWGYEKPNEVHEVERDSPKVNVWCAMSSNCIIGPYFFDYDTVDGEDYLKMLKEYFYPILVRKRIDKRIIFQQDGAPPHYRTTVRAWLNEKFPGKWIGRRGAIEWAPRSPDLTPLDFFLWGYLKQKIYSKPVKDLSELRQRITDHIQLIEPETINSNFLNIKKRLLLIKETGGAHIEQLL